MWSNATTKEMFHHTKGCIAGCTPSIAILHHGTNDVSATFSQIEIADGTISLTSDTNKNVNELMESALTIRNDKWDVKRKKVNEKLKKQCDYSSIPFIAHINIARSMSNHRKLRLNSYSTKTPPNKFFQLLGSDMIGLQG